MDDGNFRDVTPEAGKIEFGDRICVGGTFSDYDNDGDQDLYVTSMRGGNVLFQNQGQGKFRDVTEEAGLTCVAHSQTAAFFDCDNDGDLDLILTNSARWTSDAFDSKSRYYVGPQNLWDLVVGPDCFEHNVLYRNQGNGTFADATEEAGLKGRGWGGDVAAFDFDEDGDQDLFVTNMFGASQFYGNDGQGRFTEVTHQVLGKTSFGAIGTKAFDFNNDGRLDLFVADMHSDMWLDLATLPPPSSIEPQRKYRFRLGPQVEDDVLKQLAELVWMDQLEVEYADVVFGNTLYRNQGNRLVEVSEPAGTETFWPWGAATGDFDNDGYEDVFLPSGMGYPFFYWPNALLMNNGDGTFTERAKELGIEPPRRGTELETRIGVKSAARSSRCAATADFDGDGRLEIVVNNFNDRPYLFKNNLPRRNYVEFRLRGTKSNRDAIGAVVKLHFGKETMVRQVQAAGGYLSQSSKTLHFGLGDRTTIDRVEIRWPSGQRQELTEVAVGRLHEFTEPAEGSSPGAVIQ